MRPAIVFDVPILVGPQPTYTGIDLDTIADQLIARYPS
jgi:hypothetical protein